MDARVILNEALKLQTSKRSDYTSANSGQYQNFERVASVVEWFKDPQDQVFVTLIMTKIARLAALLEKGHDKPKHESVYDTFVDLTNYSSLWAGKRMEFCEGELRDSLPMQEEHRSSWDRDRLNNQIRETVDKSIK